MLFVPLCYNKVQRSRGTHFRKWFLINHSWSNWNWLWAEAGEKPGRKPLGAKDWGEKQQQFNPPTTPVFEPCLHFGRRVLSPLRTPASLKRSKQTTHSLVLTLTALPHSRSTHFTLEGTVSAHKVFISLPLAKRFKPGAECIWTNVDTSC